MPDLVVALVYLGILLLPIVVAAKNIPHLGKDESESRPFRGWEIWR